MINTIINKIKDRITTKCLSFVHFHYGRDSGGEDEILYSIDNVLMNTILSKSEIAFFSHFVQSDVSVFFYYDNCVGFLYLSPAFHPDKD